MRLGNYEVSARGIVNVVKEEERKVQNEKERAKTAKKIMNAVYQTAMFRSRAKIERWLQARQTAEQIISPDNTELIRIFKDLEVDLHLWALMQTIRLKVLANNFFIYDKNDEVDEVATKNFHKKWYRKSRRYIVDSEFYGFSLIQLGDIIGQTFSDVALVPRQYVIQQKGGVKKSLANRTDLIPYASGVYSAWLIPVGETDNLGLLDKAAPMVIKKKEVISAWSEAAEIFGMPLRVGRTEITDPERAKNMDEMLENIGAAGWARIGHDDVLEFVETSKTDFYRIYQEFVNTANSELSKGFLLQTGTTDEKAYSGSAGVHENVLKDLIEAYIQLVEEVTNEEIIPRMVRFGILPEGHYMKSDNEQKLSLPEMVKLVGELLKSYKIPEDWIDDTFGVPVEEKEIPESLDPEKAIEEIADPEASPSTVMDKLKNLYSSNLKTVK